MAICCDGEDHNHHKPTLDSDDLTPTPILPCEMVVSPSFISLCAHGYLLATSAIDYNFLSNLHEL